MCDSVNIYRHRPGRRSRAWGEPAGIPVIYCKPGERKHLIAGQYLAARQPATGVFLILAAKAMTPVWKVKQPASRAIGGEPPPGRSPAG